MREAKFETQLNIRVRESEKQELKRMSERLDMEVAQLGRIALRRGMKIIKERGIQEGGEMTRNLDTYQEPQ